MPVTDSARVRDDAWLRTQVESHQSGLLRYAASLTQNTEESAEIVQETYFRLWVHRRKVDAESARPWLFRTCRNLCFDYWRRRKGSPVDVIDSFDLDQLPADTESVDDAHMDSGAEIVAALLELPELQREVLRLRYQSDLSYKEISQITGKSVSHIGVAVHSAIAALRKHFVRAQLANGGDI